MKDPEAKNRRATDILFEAAGYPSPNAMGPGPDDRSVTIRFANGAEFHFWPGNGWWNRKGGGQGRGVHAMRLNSETYKPKPQPMREVKEGEVKKAWMTEVERHTEEKKLVFLRGLALGFAIGGSLKFFLDSLFQ